MKNLRLSLLAVALLYACSGRNYNADQQEKGVLLVASKQQATSLWRLILYTESTFMFRNSGIRTARNYSGIFKIHCDTLSLSYNVRHP